ncbi:hypothetical protein OAM69_02265 [bacterium]|nr:hypothetical protein [bacterium]
MSLDESVEKIFAAYLTLPMVLIRPHLFGWLEQGELPRDLTDKEMEELDSYMEPWIDDFEAVRYQACKRVKLDTLKSVKSFFTA